MSFSPGQATKVLIKQNPHRFLRVAESTPASGPYANAKDS